MTNAASAPPNPRRATPSHHKEAHYTIAELRALLDQWVEEQIEAGLAGSTVHTYEYHPKHFFQWVEAQP
jgi:hypothetical protein